MKTIIKIAKYLLEWVFTLIGWLLLIGAFANFDQFSSNYGEDAGTALLIACWGAVAGLVWKTFNLLGMRAFAASFFEWIATLGGWGLLGLAMTHTADITSLYGQSAGAAVGAVCLVMFFVLLWKTFSLIDGGEDQPEKKAKKKSTTRKTSTVKKVAAAGVAAKVYQNIARKPTIIPPPNCEVLGMKQKGFGAKWEITYRTADNSVRKTTIGHDTTGFTSSAGTFKVSRS